MGYHEEISKEFKERLSNESANRMPQSDVTPTLQVLGARGVKAKHMDKIRSDPSFCERIARYMRVGGWNMTASETDALNILGEDHFVIAEESSALLSSDNLGKFPSWELKKVPYTIQTLHECMADNIGVVGQDWRLVFINDLSPMTLFDWAGGHDCFAHPIFDVGRMTFQRWESEHVPCNVRGYRLINFNPQFSNSSQGIGIIYAEQLKCVQELGNSEIAPAHFVLEAWLSHHLLTGQTYLRKTAGGCEHSGHHHIAIGKETDNNPNSFVLLQGFGNWNDDSSSVNPNKPRKEVNKKFLVQHGPTSKIPVFSSGVMVMKKPDLV